MSHPAWSVVIPAHNEVERLPRSLDEVLGFFDGRGLSYEVLVVDDGSTDGAPHPVRGVSRLHPAVRLLRGEDNRGKGAVVRAGMLPAAGAVRLFTDADGATPISELKRILKARRRVPRSA